MNESTPSGRRVGRYVLVERLGGGGMGEVFRATDRLGVAVALKQLAVNGAPSPCIVATSVEASAAPRATEPATAPDAPIAAGIVPASPLARPLAATLGLALAREFRALSALRHPNVVEVLDYGFDGPRPFFTMQLLEGGVPITTATRGASFERKVLLLAQLLRAVRYIHSRGVLHRDLSAGNVVVAADTVKVLDFGLAVLRDERDPRLARWGTRGYRAPEIELGGLPSRRGDLYAVGVIGLEVLLERRMETRADVERARDATVEIDARVRAIFVALTAEDPLARPDDAGAVLLELARATGIALPLDTTETLDSALTTASLVGRDRELALLDDALRALVASRRGSAFRIEGESGIGKSRLMDELRTRALVAGCLVLEGQAREEGGGPYEVLAGLVRGLALEVDVREDEAMALAPVVELGASSAADRVATPADPEIARARMFDAIAALLARVGEREPRPIVVLLEDLQWSTDDANRLVARVAGLAKTRPILVVATRRDAVEATELEELDAIRLGRIDDAAARELVRSALASAPGDVAERVVRESEGHPFFLVELLRWIAEHGRDADVPHRIEALVVSRLEAFATAERELVEIAAVVGRDVDPTLLAAIAGVDEGAVDTGIRAGIAAGLFEVRSERVRFTHDKMREAILASLSDSRLRAVHRRAAEVIEARADAADSAALAHHFARAGDDAKTAHWAAIAGERAFAAGAGSDAIRLLGESLRASRGDGDDIRRAYHLRLISDAHHRIGNYAAAHESAVAALEALGRRRRGAAMRTVEAIADAGAFAMRELRGARSTSTASAVDSSLALDEATEAYYRVAETALFRDAPGDLLWGLTRAMALVEGRPPATEITIFSAAGFLAGTMGIERLAAMWNERAMRRAKEIGSQPLLAAALHRSGVCAVVRADWDVAEDLLSRAREIATRAADRRQWQETTTVLGLSMSYRGDERRAADLLAAVHESASNNGDRQGTLWGASLSALCLLRLGETSRAEQLLEEARTRIDATTSVFDRVNYHGTRAFAVFGAGERDEAVREATDVVNRLASMKFSAYWTFHGLAAAVDTLLAAAENEDDPRERRALLEVVARGCGEGRRLARACVFARPVARAWKLRAKELAKHHA